MKKYLNKILSFLMLFAVLATVNNLQLKAENSLEQSCIVENTTLYIVHISTITAEHVKELKALEGINKLDFERMESGQYRLRLFANEKMDKKTLMNAFSRFKFDYDIIEIKKLEK